MNKFVILCLLSVVAVATSRRMVLGRPKGGFVGGDHTEYDAVTITPLNFAQKIDHYNPNSGVYQQRYWHNSNSYNKSGNVFLLIQGEGIATDAWASNPDYTYLKLASLYGADAYQLEHRCFGYSRPYSDMSVDHLSVCNADQALKDIHDFIVAMKANYVEETKWITFGGSYPGFLSAAFRMKYPNDTVGAVASSAPMLWTLDYFQYAQVVQNVMYDVSKQCGDNIQNAFQTMQSLSLSSNGRDKLNSYFNIIPAFDGNSTQLDIDNFFANVFGVFQDVTQYTFDGRNAATRGGLNVNNLCNIMTSQNDSVLAVVQVLQWYNDLNGVSSPTFDNSYANMMQDLSNITYDDEDPFQDRAAGRGWMWLCCSGMGVLQTTDQGYNIFQQTIPLNYFVDQCNQMFQSPNMNIKTIRDNNIAFNKIFGGIDHYTATNIVLPNGSYDPWHILGLNWNNTQTHVSSILIPKAGHCSDMYPVYSNEPAGLKNARDYINKEVAYFLGVPVVPFPQ